MKKGSYLTITALCLVQLAGFPQSILPQKNNAALKIKPAISIKAYAFNLIEAQTIDVLAAERNAARMRPSPAVKRAIVCK